MYLNLDTVEIVFFESKNAPNIQGVFGLFSLIPQRSNRPRLSDIKFPFFQGPFKGIYSKEKAIGL